MKSIFFLLTGLFPILVFGQFDFHARERELAETLDSLRAAKDNAAKKKWNDIFKKDIANTLEQPHVFDHQFTLLPSVGIIESPDHLLKIVNWNVEQDDQTQVYNAFVLLKDARKGTHKVWELIDKSWMLMGEPKEILESSSWYGALYYSIIPVEKNNKTYYTVLGWDGGTRMSNTKLIDVIHFTGNKLKLGAPIFKTSTETLNRVFFEHSERAYMSLKYESQYKRIIFDHLSPETPAVEGVREFYVPDMSYDAFIFENGKWILKEDVIGVNKKSDAVVINAADPRTGEVKEIETDGKWVDPTSSGSPASKEVHIAVTPDQESKTTSETDAKKKDSKEQKSAMEIYEEKNKGKKDKGGKSILGNTKKPKKKRR
jgi:hypothetical protein